MHKYVKELLGGSLIYGLSGTVTSVISLFLVPIYTRVFTTDDYGVLSLVNTTYFLLTIFVIFGLDNSAALWYWDKAENEERKKTFASWAYFSLTLSVVIAIPIMLFSKQLSALLLNNAHFYVLLNLMALTLVFASMQKVTNIWFRVQKKPAWAMIYALLVSLTTIGFSLLLVVKLDLGLSGVYWAQLGAAIICFAVSIFLMNSWILPQYFDWRRLREMLVFAVPLIPAVLSFWLMNSAGSYFIQHYVDKTEVGLYQLGNSLASGIGLVTSAFMQAWSPFAFSIAKEENHRQIYADIFLLYVYWSSLALLGFVLFVPEALMILAPPAFGDSALVAGLLALNIFVLSLPQIIVIGCALVKTNSPFGTATILGSIVSVILFFTLIPRLGKEGAVLSTIIGNTCIFVFVYFRAQKLYFIPYALLKAVLALSGAATLATMGLWLSQLQSLAMSVIMKIVVIIIYAAFAVFQSFRLKRNGLVEDIPFNSDTKYLERNKAKKLIKKLFVRKA